MTPFEGPLTTAAELASVLDHVPAIVALLDLDRRNRFANWAHTYWYGKAPHEMLGLHSIDVLGADLYEESRPYFDAVREGGEPQSYERLVVTPSGERRHTVVQLEPYIRDGNIAGIVVLASDVTGRVRADFTRREIAARLETIGERERTAATVEESATCRLEAVAERLAAVAPDGAETSIAPAAAAIAAAARELRALIGGRGVVSGPEEEIRTALARTTTWLGFAPTLVVLGTLHELDDETTALIGDVLAETLLNVARHAGAERVAVTLAIEGGDVVVVVADDGGGAVVARPSSGLDRLRKTAQDRGGRLTWVINDDDGTTVEWRVPLRAAAAVGAPERWAQVQSSNPSSARGVRLPPQDYRTPETLALDEDELRVLLDLLPMGLTVWDRRLRNTFANRTAATWTHSPDQHWMLGRGFAEVSAREALQRLIPLSQAALSGSHFVQESPLNRGPGTPKHVRTEYIPMIVEHEIRGVHVQVTDIGAQVQAQSAAREDAVRVAAITARHRADEDAHHVAIQHLFAAGLELDRLRLRHSGEIGAVIERALDDVHEAIADLRASVIAAG